MIAIEKIRLINFQSHEDTEISFGPQLNVIIGGSDQGKTAIIRAIRWLLYNEPRGTDFMRIGANTCKVIATLTDGTQIIRERTLSRNTYTLIKPDGEEQKFEGFGGGVPEEITRAHGMGKILLDTDIETSLNIGYQLDGPFLLSETGATRAKAIGRIVGIHLIDSAIRMVIKDLSQLNQEQRTLSNLIKDFNEQLLFYNDLDNEEKQIDHVDELLMKVERKINTLDKLKVSSSNLKTIVSEMEKQQRIIAKLSNITSMENLLEKIIYHSQFCRRLSLLQEREKIVKGHLTIVRKIIANTMNIFEADNLLSLLNSDYLPQSEHLRSLKIKIDDVNGKILKHELLLQELNRTKEAEQLYFFLEDTYNLKLKISELNCKLSTLTDGIKKGKKYLHDNKATTKILIEQYNSTLTKMGRCPLCYSKISEDVSTRITNEYKKEEGL